MVIMEPKAKECSLSEDLSDNKKCCTDCKTTKTPLWRGGPAGPKTLCNACGIRYRKRRVCTVGLNKGQERKRAQSRCGAGTANDASSSAKTVGNGVGCSDLREFLKLNVMALGEEVLLQRSTPSIVKKQRRKLGEEEQAAVCLMALSCGFVFA